mgnify:FL=1
MQPVHEPANLIEAYLVKGLLARAGIESWVRGEHLVGAIGELPAVGLLAVMVADEDAEQARALVEDWSRAAPLDEESPGADGSLLA